MPASGLFIPSPDPGRRSGSDSVPAGIAGTGTPARLDGAEPARCPRPQDRRLPVPARQRIRVRGRPFHTTGAPRRPAEAIR